MDIFLSVVFISFVSLFILLTFSTLGFNKIGIFISALNINIQLLSLYLIDDYFGYTALVNISPKQFFGLLSDFYFVVIFSIVTLLISFYILKIIISYINKNLKYSIFLISPFVFLCDIYFKTGPIHKIKEIYDINHGGEIVNLSSYDYDVSGADGKHLVVIVAESLEKSFITKELTPNLFNLKQEWRYYPMEQSHAWWTAGSIYTMLTGLSAIFPNSVGNEIFQGVKNINIPSLGKTLKSAGYNPVFVKNNIDFAGLRDLLVSDDFRVVTNDYKRIDNLGAFRSRNDISLFSEAKLQFDNMLKSDKKVALFLTSLNTHFPGGVYDPAGKVLTGLDKKDFDNNVIDYSAFVLDYLIGDFINFIDERVGLDNVNIVIFPDHKLMGNLETATRFKEAGDRGLYVLNNSAYNHVGDLLQSDLPSFILKSTNVKYNSDFFNEFEYASLSELSAYNSAALDFNSNEFSINFNSANFEDLSKGLRSFYYIDGIYHEVQHRGLAFIDLSRAGSSVVYDFISDSSAFDDFIYKLHLMKDKPSDFLLISNDSLGSIPRKYHSALIEHGLVKLSDYKPRDRYMASFIDGKVTEYK